MVRETNHALDKIVSLFEKVPFDVNESMLSLNPDRFGATCKAQKSNAEKFYHYSQPILHNDWKRIVMHAILILYHISATRSQTTEN